MTIYLIAFFAVFMLGSFGLPSVLSSMKGDDLSRNVTSAINGLFISIVFLSHLRSYIPEASFAATDGTALLVMTFLGQLIVATFLFFSGFGAMQSIKKRGFSYVWSFPAHRILSFLLDVWLALGMYMLVRIVMGWKLPSVPSFLLAMVGWNSIGNSNWYIFAILMSWVFTYVAFRLFPREGQRWMAISAVILLMLGYIYVLRAEEMPARFYNTILCYPAGMVLSLCIDALGDVLGRVRHPRLTWVAGFGGALLLFLLVYYCGPKGAVFYNLRAISFALLVAVVSYATTSVSVPFLWAGNNLFYLYIYQRIPMILLRPLANRSTLLYTTACLVAAILLCAAMSRLHVLWRRFWLEKPSNPQLVAHA